MSHWPCRLSSARLLMKKPVLLSCRDEAGIPVCSLWWSLLDCLFPLWSPRYPVAPLGTLLARPPPGWPIPPPLEGSACVCSGRSLTPLSLPLWSPLSGWAGIILTLRCNSCWWDSCLCNFYWWIPSGDLFGFLAGRRMGQPVGIPCSPG